jgi:hypothetical protein
MIIALDYDETYTLDPDFWDQFLRSAKAAGHDVFICTMRNDDEMLEVYALLNGKVTAIFNTSRKAKRPYMQSQGINIDVWIDDRPEFVVFNANPSV